MNINRILNKKYVEGVKRHWYNGNIDTVTSKWKVSKKSIHLRTNDVIKNVYMLYVL